MKFDEALIKRKTPWAACAEMENFFSHGGRCRPDDATNWAGILFLCAMNVRSDPSLSESVFVPPNVDEAFAWTHLIIEISESLARAESSIIPIRCFQREAMWARAHMIIRCGDLAGDSVCDAKKVTDWCMSLPDMGQLLALKQIPIVREIDPDVRQNVEILEALVAAGRIEEKGAVANIIQVIKRARQSANSTDPLLP